MVTRDPSAPPASPTDVSFAEAVRVWARIGWLSFGGPAGQVALMHRELVERRKWLDEARFLHALNYCMLLPGPEAQQLATYIGWLMHRTRGGLAAGLLFVLPGFIAIALLSVLYALWGDVAFVSALFFGLKAAVLAIVIEALLRIGRRALANGVMVAIAALGFVSIFFLALPFPVVVVAAGVVGLLGRRFVPRAFPPPRAPAGAQDGSSVIDRMAATGGLAHTRPSWRKALRVLGTCLVLWTTPLVALALAFGRDSVFVKEGLFFSQAALVTFGGAYAVLAYIAQRAVETYGWLMPGEMLDGLGLAETTPGPLIMVVQFVGFLGAYRHAGGLPPLLAGLLGAIVTVWVTFVPCFLWIFAGAPYIEALRGNRSLHSALSAITATVVGVIANLSMWFALHVLFARVDERHVGPLRLLRPDLASFDVAAAGLSAVAMLAIFVFKLGIARTLALCGGLGILVHLILGAT